jgi:Concanavalin A-like lectin/glucanases superfamily/Secretion system C-terminal sorting domain
MKKLGLLFFGGFFALHVSAQNNALNFDGVDDYVQTSLPSIQGTAAKTYEAWIRTTANANPNAGGTQKAIIDMGSFTTGGRFTMSLLFNNGIRIEVGGSGLNSTRPLNDGQWHHVAAVYDPLSSAASYFLYVDGALDTSGVLPTSINTGNGDVVIGRRMDGINRWNGDLDEIRIWSVARTASEIQSNYNKRLCSFPGSLAGYYRFNQGVAGGNNVLFTTAINELTRNGDGILNNFSLSGNTSNWVASGVNLDTVDTRVTRSGNSFTAMAANAQFQWLNCNGFSAISNATNSTFSATANGTYAVRVTQGGCVDTSACYSVTGVGTSSTTLEENLLIYPLPMSDGGTVQFGGQGAFSLKLVDLTGKIVLFQNGNGTSPLFISTTTLKDGLYLLELESQTGVFIRKKAMILH